MTVIVINEDNHGMIGIAKDYENAINFLLQDHWLDTDLEVVDENGNIMTLKEMGISIADIRAMDDIYKFNEFFEGIFYLDLDTVWGM